MSSSSEYQKLKKIWYAKLEKAGFDDIEQDDGYGNLKVWSYKFARVPALMERQEYSIMATRFLNDYAFKTKKEEVIWAYHAEAISHRKIAELLKKARLRNISETKILYCILRLRAEMFKMYGVSVR